MRRILTAVLAAVIIFAGAVQVWGYDTYDFTDNYKIVGSKEAGSGKVSISGRENTYITANTKNGYTYIVDGNGNKLIDRLFTGVFDGMFLNRYLIVRFYGTEDLSGFGVLTGSQLYTLVPNDNYYYIRAKFCRSGYNLICEKRDESGELKATYYRFDGNYNLVGLFDYDNSYAPDNYVCSDFAEEKIKKADEEGLLLNPLRHRDLSDDVTRYELACLGVQAVLRKSGKDIYTYIADNDITIDYDKYIDVVSPDVLLAEQLGLITPGIDSRYFNPERAATREEAAACLYRLCQLLDVKTSLRDKNYDDHRTINVSSRLAVYYVTGTKAGDTYLMDDGKDNCFLPDDPYSLENTIISIYHIFDFYDLASEDTTQYNKTYIGCDTYLFQNSIKKWGAMTKDGEVIVEPKYELAGAYVNKAVDNVFVLSDENNYYNGRNNTYYVFDTEGNLLKTLHYGSEEMEADGFAAGSTYVYSATGSNLLYWIHFGDNIASPNEREGFAYLKRLISEEVAAAEYDGVTPYGDEGLFTGYIGSTGEKVILNPDGTFKEYCTTEEDGE
ncbi:MAG: hypothetical protein LUD81_04720 [Clostridiales bacterium]|nr:hypothetical protein [Clostridiales bacterium]